MVLAVLRESSAVDTTADLDIDEVGNRDEVAAAAAVGNRGKAYCNSDAILRRDL